MKSLSSRKIIFFVVLMLIGCSDESTIPSNSPMDNIRFGHYGAEYRSPAVTTKDRRLSYWAQELASDYMPPKVDKAPAQFTSAHLDFSCDIPRVSQNAHVAFVEIYQGSVDLPLYFIELDDIAQFSGNGEKTRWSPNAKRLLEQAVVDQVDVYITETSKPVYLVLSAYDKTLWSLHLAADVHLYGVAVIGYEAQALAYLPPNTPVGFVVYEKSQIHCMPKVSIPVDESWWIIELNQKNGGNRFTSTIESSKEKHARFHEWLYWRVGEPDVVLSANRTGHILIGPKPTNPIPYHSLAGTNILYTPNVRPVWGDSSDAKKVLLVSAQ